MGSRDLSVRFEGIEMVPFNMVYHLCQPTRTERPLRDGRRLLAYVNFRKASYTQLGYVPLVYSPKSQTL